MKKIGIFYGPVGGNTELIAKKIAQYAGTDNCDLIALKTADIEDIEKYDNIIFGIATIGKETWDAEPVESGWHDFMPRLEKADLQNKNIAIFGLGDHIRWPKHFVDSMGELYHSLKDKGVETIGKVKPDDYTFDESEALIDGMFAGLPVDEDFESDQSDRRIREWIDRLKEKFV